MAHRPSMVPLVAISLLGVAATASRLPAQLPPPPAPPENPVTPARAVLGKILFWDEQLSSDGTMACGTCHQPEAGGSDPRAARATGADGIPGTADDSFGSFAMHYLTRSRKYVPFPGTGFGRQVTSRWTPSVLGAAYFDALFWDGRAATTFLDPESGQVVIGRGGALEQQALEPPLALREMAHDRRTWQQVTDRLSTVAPLHMATDWPTDVAQALAVDPTYPELFDAAFGDPSINARRIAMALATYQRTLVPDATPWDDWQRGATAALSPLQQQGLALFEGKAGCVGCHARPLFSDGGFHNTGVRPVAEDPGRMAVTGNALHRGQFRTPSLRNVGLRTRLLHNGGAASLRDLIEFYDRGGDFADNLDPLVRPLGLSQAEKLALLAFLDGGLDDPRVAAAAAPFDRPTLHSEAGTPSLSAYGTATPGSGGIAPTLLAHSPPALGNDGFKLGVANALGGALGVLALAVTPGTGTDVSGVAVYVGLTPAPYLLPLVLKQAGMGPGAGHGTLNLPVAMNPALVGAAFHAQWFVLDPGAAGGGAATAAVRFRFF